MMNVHQARARRLQIELKHLLLNQELYGPDDMDGLVSQARNNALVVLDSLPPCEFFPESDSSSIDEITGDVYTDGIWQPELIAVLNATCVLSDKEDPTP